MSQPTVFVCAGSGGVGKTTTSAAWATALAKSGEPTLLVTVDPARRLAQALGVSVEASVSPVSLPGVPEDTLFALMPEPRQSTEVLVGMLFRDVPDAGTRFRDNRIYRALQHSMAGIHDLTSLMLLAAALEERPYRYLVVDTAPSRFGLDFLTYPGRLAHLFEGRAIGFLGTLGGRSLKRQSERPPARERRDERGFFAWGKKQLEAALSKVLDPDTFYDLTHLFFELATIRRRFSTLARSAERLLLGPETRFLIVATPSLGSEADARFIAHRLSSVHEASRARGPHAILLNRSDEHLPEWFRVLRERDDASEPMQHTLRDLRSELDARRRAGDSMEHRLAADFPHTKFLRLPTIEERDPAEIVAQLSAHLAAAKDSLLAS